MKKSDSLALGACFLLFALTTCAQVKDMPSQAEFDPILENADNKIKDFLSTLLKYRTEATEIDKQRFEKDLHDFQQLRQIIDIAHSGTGNHGINVSRVLSIVAGADDAAMEAAVWSNLLTTRICGPHKQSLLYFALAVQDNGGMLREVSNQLFHPALRMASAADEIMVALGNSASPKR